ncbi:MAG: hypothetical protein WA816_03530 [Bacteroidales bacterium]
MKKETTFRKKHNRLELNTKENKRYVYPIREWKEYLGESFLIVFSVLLALGLSEYFSKIHEKENTQTILKSVADELRNNKKALGEMQDYNLKVLAKIDSALTYKKIQKKLVSNDEFHLDVIAPDGIQYRYLENAAWTIAKNNNIMSKIDIESVSILSRVYGDQDRIDKVEEEVAKIIFDRASRDPKQIRKTLILIKDNYRGWVVDRVPGMFIEIDSALKKIEKY